MDVFWWITTLILWWFNMDLTL